MFIGVVNAALAAMNDEVPNTDARSGSTVEQFRSAMSDKPPSKGPIKTSLHTESSKMNPAFDAWLENKLHRMFDTVAAEPLPADLLKLLEQLDKKTSPPDGNKKDE